MFGRLVCLFGKNGILGRLVGFVRQNKALSVAWCVLCGKIKVYACAGRLGLACFCGQQAPERLPEAIFEGKWVILRQEAPAGSREGPGAHF